jgi:hypothetical protein
LIDAVNLLNARATWLYDDHLRVTTYVNNLLLRERLATIRCACRRLR